MENELIAADKLLRNIGTYPHVFVLACLMDTGMDANKAWAIPYKVYSSLNTFDIEKLYTIQINEYTDFIL